jgi:hypothetical protein
MSELVNKDRGGTGSLFWAKGCWQVFNACCANLRKAASGRHGVAPASTEGNPIWSCGRRRRLWRQRLFKSGVLGDRSCLVAKWVLSTVIGESIVPTPLIASYRARPQRHPPEVGFNWSRLPCGDDPPREVAVWRKSVVRLLLISEHDVRV